MLGKLRSLFGRESGGVAIALFFLAMGAVFSYYEANQAVLNRQTRAHVQFLQTEVAREKERAEHLKAASSPEAIEATKEAIARNEEGAVAPGEQPVVPLNPTPTPTPEAITTPTPSRAEAWWELFFGK